MEPTQEDIKQDPLEYEPQRNVGISIQDWYDPAVTIKTEPVEDKNAEIILPDWSYLTPGSNSEAAEEENKYLVTTGTAVDSFAIKVEDHEQVCSEREAPLETCVEIEEFSIMPEPGEDFSVFMNLSEGEDKEMEMGGVPEEFFPLRSISGAGQLYSDGQGALVCVKQNLSEAIMKLAGIESKCQITKCSSLMAPTRRKRSERSQRARKRLAVATARAHETQEQRERRRMLDRQAKAATRAIETQEQQERRQMMNRQAMAAARATETQEQRERRQMMTRQAMAAARAVESAEQRAVRQAADRRARAAARAAQSAEQRAVKQAADRSKDCC